MPVLWCHRYVDVFAVVRCAFSPIHTHFPPTTFQVRTKCLTTITKIVHHASPAMLTVLLQDLPASSFIANLLMSKESGAICAALQLATTLLVKLPNVFVIHFIKEGVVHALRQLSTTEEPDGGAHGTRSTRRATRAGTRNRSRGGDDAEDTAPPPLSFPLSTSGVSTASCECARLVCDTHFGGPHADAPLETDGIRALRTLCDDLDTPATWTALCELLAGNGDTRVSTFEFLNSGALHHLAVYLQGQDLLGQGTMVEDDIIRTRLERLSMVAHALLARGSGVEPPAVSLVRRLQSCLSSLESLPVTYVPAPTPLTSIFRMAGLPGRWLGWCGGCDDIICGVVVEVIHVHAVQHTYVPQLTHTLSLTHTHIPTQAWVAAAATPCTSAAPSPMASLPSTSLSNYVSARTARQANTYATMATQWCWWIPWHHSQQWRIFCGGGCMWGTDRRVGRGVWGGGRGGLVKHLPRHPPSKVGGGGNRGGRHHVDRYTVFWCVLGGCMYCMYHGGSVFAVRGCDVCCGAYNKCIHTVVYCHRGCVLKHNKQLAHLAPVNNSNNNNHPPLHQVCVLPH